MWNAFIEEPERRFYDRCIMCGKRRFFSLWHEVYHLLPSCNGQCKDKCGSWSRACGPCTVKVATDVIDRLHDKVKAVNFYRIQLEKDMLGMALAEFKEGRELPEVRDSIKHILDIIIADEQHDAY